MSWLHITLICAASGLAGYVGARYRPVSEFLRIKKRMRDLEQTQADLESSFESLLASHKTLRSRAGMRELRARESAPGHETKEQARARIFGTKAGPAFAKQQLEQQ